MSLTIVFGNYIKINDLDPGLNLPEYSNGAGDRSRHRILAIKIWSSVVL